MPSPKSEIANIQTSLRGTRDGFDIDIDNIVETSIGVEVFARVRDTQGKQYGFGPDGSVDLERFVIINPPTLVQDDENGDIVMEGYDDSLGLPMFTKYRHDPEEALLIGLAHTMSVKKEKFLDSSIKAGKVGNTTTTVYPDYDGKAGATTMDGRVLRAAGTGTWASYRGGIGTHASYANAVNNICVFIDATGSSNTWEQIARFAMLFDTTAVGASDTISSATLSLRPAVNGASSFGTHVAEIGIVASSTASNTTTTITDYENMSDTDFATRKNIVDMTTGSYKNFILNAAGIANITKGGISKFGARIGMDIDNVEAWENNKEAWANLYQAGTTANTSNDPKLVVEHSAGGVTANNSARRMHVMMM